MDVESKPGPGDIMTESTDQLDEQNRQVSNASKTTYSRVFLLNIRRQYRSSVSPSVLRYPPLSLPIEFAPTLCRVRPHTFRVRPHQVEFAPRLSHV